MNSIARFTAIALVSALGSFAFSANAALINKNSGATTPNLADFSTAFANHPHKVGYNHPGSDGMFLETFRASCPKGQKAANALFKIKVKKLGQGSSSSDNDALAFWDSGGVTFNTYLWTANDPAGTVKTLSIVLSALPAADPPGPGQVVINSPPGGDGMALFNDGDFSFSVQDDTSVLEATLEYGCAPEVKKGTTWGVYPSHAVTGTALVSCQGAPALPSPNTAGCNAYAGDTPGTTVLPVLCFLPKGLPLPVPNVGDPNATHWSGGVIATTPPVSPTAQNWTLRSQVDAYCASQFGPGWVVAEHHMGNNLGWKFGAYGHVGQPGVKRFWVDVNDQPNANVWN